jgi:hypothetical protein
MGVHDRSPTAGTAALHRRVFVAIIDGNRTIADVRKAYQKASFNKAMRSDAQLRYKESGGPSACKICGEIREVDICHIKPIGEYDPSALVSEINDPGNLVVLCPLHHRLFDRQKGYSRQQLRDGYVRLGIHLVMDFREGTDLAEARRARDALRDSLLAVAERDASSKTAVSAIWIDE